ncbi:hypothetical protein OBV_41960 [Oscillibacter valericigenes Sjm18-20]|nr:hypothetical protein OBV_41960 [Oscillibacter valericigenes Sjm18-20]
MTEGRVRGENDEAWETGAAHLCAKGEIYPVEKNVLYFDIWMKYYKIIKLSDMGGQRRDIWSWIWEY